MRQLFAARVKWHIACRQLRNTYQGVNLWLHADRQEIVSPIGAAAIAAEHPGVCGGGNPAFGRWRLYGYRLSPL
jgi:hypothetical protein